MSEPEEQAAPGGEAAAQAKSAASAAHPFIDAAELAAHAAHTPNPFPTVAPISQTAQTVNKLASGLGGAAKLAGRVAAPLAMADGITHAMDDKASLRERLGGGVEAITAPMSLVPGGQIPAMIGNLGTKAVLRGADVLDDMVGESMGNRPGVTETGPDGKPQPVKETLDSVMADGAVRADRATAKAVGGVLGEGAGNFAGKIVGGGTSILGGIGSGAVSLGVGTASYAKQGIGWLGSKLGIGNP